MPRVVLAAKHLAAKLPHHIQVSDLISAGTEGLMQAMEKYDSRPDCTLDTFANLRIRGAMIDEMRKFDAVPRTVRAKQKQYRESHEALTQGLGRDPSATEIAEKIGIPLQRLSEYEESLRAGVHSMNELVGNGDAFVERGELMADEEAVAPFTNLVNQENREILGKIISELPQYEKTVICLLYLEELSQTEISAIIGVSKSRISQVHLQALGRLLESYHKYAKTNLREVA